MKKLKLDGQPSSQTSLSHLNKYLFLPSLITVVYVQVYVVGATDVAQQLQLREHELGVDGTPPLYFL